MLVLSISVGMFVFAFAVQALLWRLWFPPRQTPALLIVYALVPLIVISIALLAGHWPIESPSDALRFGVFYGAVALDYIAVYSALEIPSPTLSIVSFVAKRGSGGCAERELFDRFGRGEEIYRRFDVMESGGLVAADGTFVTLTDRGRMLASLFDRAAHICGIAKGG